MLIINYACSKSCNLTIWYFLITMFLQRKNVLNKLLCNTLFNAPTKTIFNVFILK